VAFAELEKRAMTQALIFVNCDATYQEMVRDNVAQVRGVNEVNMTSGIYDLIVKAESDTEEKLREDIIRKIRSIGGVRSTATMIIFQPNLAAAGSAL
jgi:DNA-binding Lrp family transcriptional regulator